MWQLLCIDFKQDVYVKNDTRCQGPSNKYKAKTNINTVPIESRFVYNLTLNKKSWWASLLEEAKDKRPLAITNVYIQDHTQREIKSPVATKQRLESESQ